MTIEQLIQKLRQLVLEHPLLAQQPVEVACGDGDTLDIDEIIADEDGIVLLVDIE